MPTPHSVIAGALLVPVVGLCQAAPHENREIGVDTRCVGIAVEASAVVLHYETWIDDYWTAYGLMAFPGQSVTGCQAVAVWGDGMPQLWAGEVLFFAWDLGHVLNWWLRVTVPDGVMAGMFSMRVWYTVGDGKGPLVDIWQ